MAPVLAGFTATVRGGTPLPLQVCAAHLKLLGAEMRTNRRQGEATR